MKPTNTLTMRHKAGMTLLELTVVILVLLSLISILFIGARAWKKGSDRAANILNIRNVQQAVRAHANIRGLAIGAPLASSEIVGPNKYVSDVVEPNTDITYGFLENVPNFGTLYLTQTYSDTGAADYAPATSLYADW